MPGALGVRETELERVFRREERDHAVARDVDAEVDHEMAEIVFFAGADGAVREEDERLAPDQSAHRMVRVDPRIHPGRRVQFRPGRPELDGNDGSRCAERAQQRALGARLHQGSINDALVGLPGVQPPRSHHALLLGDHLQLRDECPHAHRHGVRDAGRHGEPRTAERGHQVSGAEPPDTVAPQDARHAARGLGRPAVGMGHRLQQRPQPRFVSRGTDGQPRRIDAQQAARATDWLAGSRSVWRSARSRVRSRSCTISGAYGHHLTKRAAVGPQRIGNHARIAGIVLGRGRRKPARKPLLLLRIDRKDGESGVETRLDERTGPQFDADGNRGRRHATDFPHPGERVVNSEWPCARLAACRARGPRHRSHRTHDWSLAQSMPTHQVLVSPLHSFASAREPPPPWYWRSRRNFPLEVVSRRPGRGAGLKQVLEAQVRSGTLDRGRPGDDRRAAGTVEAAAAVDAHIASTAPWKTLRLKVRGVLEIQARLEVRGKTGPRSRAPDLEKSPDLKYQ